MEYSTEKEGCIASIYVSPGVYHRLPLIHSCFVLHFLCLWWILLRDSSVDIQTSALSCLDLSNAAVLPRE